MSYLCGGYGLVTEFIMKRFRTCYGVNYEVLMDILWHSLLGGYGHIIKIIMSP